MASLGGAPQNVTYQTVNVSAGGGNENLLINPRGKINQAEENDGALSAGTYFCDGWKAGSSGAEIYRDPDGFRLISGSILQLVPNNLDAGRTIRGNMDILNGTPEIKINGGSDNELSDTGEYIQFEVSGNNSKFNRLILAESVSLPMYQQVVDELKPCLKFYQSVKNQSINTYKNSGAKYFGYGLRGVNFISPMYKQPAVVIHKLGMYSGGNYVDYAQYGTSLSSSLISFLLKYYDSGLNLSSSWASVSYVADARI